MMQLNRTIAVLARALMLGLHWTFLQSVAWMSMLVRYSQDGSLASAVVRTFDGEHPCALCVQIAEGKKAEGEKEREYPVQKLDLLCQLPAAFIFAAPRFSDEHTGDCTAPLRAVQPPTPPPRSA